MMCGAGAIKAQLEKNNPSIGAGGELSSGGIGSAMALTRPPGSGSTRLQRKGSLANFMALFGPQQGTV